MTTQNQTTNVPARRVITPELARRALAEGKVTMGNRTAYVMTDSLSALPPVKNEQLVSSDFWIIRNCGEVTTEYGEAWIFEIGRKSDTPTNSWLVGKPIGNKNDSIVGKNIKRHFDRNGGDALPVWVHLEYHDEGRGNAYYSLGAPQALLDAAEVDPPTPPQKDLDDLPF